MKLQVSIDENLYRILTEMGDAKLRGKNRSEVAYNILEEWTWDNQEKLKEHKIYLTKKKPTTQH
jgi:acyl-CoA hydrolase